jgi:predicted Rossmann fold flavoprotein
MVALCSHSEMKRDVIVIGGGAAGVFCAIQAGKRGRSALVLEHKEKIGKKILISGGGRCNFTNLHAGPANFICGNPHFHKSALARFTPRDLLELVERHGIRYHEKKSGQLFCNGSAQEIISMLERESVDAAVEFRVNCPVHAIEKRDRFLLETDQGRFECQSLVVATGGLSLPKIGATDFGYRIARQFGLRVTQTKPALVPLTLSEHDRSVFSPLSGIAVDALVSLGDRRFRENILVTHRGLSGPAILQISSYWNPQERIEIDLLPDIDTDDLLRTERDSAKELKTILSRHWPRRFAKAWIEVCADSRPLRQYSNRELEEIAARLHHWEILPDGTAGYGKAEVTAGGVDADELNSKTMEARRVPGLYFIGEVVDVTGQLGGFNLQWAWASGYAAGQVV